LNDQAGGGKPAFGQPRIDTLIKLVIGGACSAHHYRRPAKNGIQ
jgi:hypothetical protein